jgi:hypothetical protein
MRPAASRLRHLYLLAWSIMKSLVPKYKPIEV